MTVKSSPTRPGIIAGKATKPDAQKKITVRAPDGKIEEHTISNAYDLINHLGWVVHVEKPASAASVEVETGVVDPSVPPAGSDGAEGKEPDAPKASDAVLALEALRVKAKGLGIEVDMRWGTKRLDEEITKAEAKQAAETPAA